MQANSWRHTQFPCLVEHKNKYEADDRQRRGAPVEAKARPIVASRPADLVTNPKASIAAIVTSDTFVRLNVAA